MKVFCLPSHATKERTSGVDFLRVIQPMQHLNGIQGIETTIYDIHQQEKLNWVQVAQEFDVIYLNYTIDAWHFAGMGALARKYKRKIVMDMDDSLFDVLPDNNIYKLYTKGSEGRHNLTAMLNEVDYVTCTNLYLKHAISHNTLKTHDKIKVFPNYINLDLYKHRSPFRDANEIRLTHFGSTTHFKSLSEKSFEQGIDRIMKTYPNVTLRTIGANIQQYRYKWGHRYEYEFGHQDIYHWIQDPDKFPKFMDETDIMVVPLSLNTYNKAKSSTKYLEASSAVKPGVWQNIRQYEEVVRDGENGFLAETADDWFNAISKLIEDKQLRKNMGEAAFKTVQDGWQMKDHVDEYAEFFLNL